MNGPVPPIGLGTSRNDDPAQCARSVRRALEVGYRHVDTAQGYGNEAAVGAGIAEAEVTRSEVFVATKVTETNLGYDDVIASTEASLARLDTDYIDLLYVHWPTDAYEPETTLPAFDALREEGLIRHVGMSNCTVDVLEEARTVLEAPIVANQIEVHPMLPPDPEMVSYAREHAIDLVGYSPFCRGEALDLPAVADVAERYGVSPARVILAWLLDAGVKPIPKAVGDDHIEDNYAARALELDEDDRDRIESVRRRRRRFDRPTAPWHQ